MANRDHDEHDQYGEQDDASSAYAPPGRRPGLRSNPSMLAVAALVVVALVVVALVLLLG